MSGHDIYLMSRLAGRQLKKNEAVYQYRQYCFVNVTDHNILEPVLWVYLQSHSAQVLAYSYYLQTTISEYVP